MYVDLNKNTLEKKTPLNSYFWSQDQTSFIAFIPIEYNKNRGLAYVIKLTLQYLYQS